TSVWLTVLFVFVFFFQAEDGIRDRNVTGVQTCALPIYTARWLACSWRSTSRAIATSRSVVSAARYTGSGSVTNAKPERIAFPVDTSTMVKLEADNNAVISGTRSLEEERVDEIM